jgi:hypothetical protein
MNKNNNIYYTETNTNNAKEFCFLPEGERISYYDLSVEKHRNKNRSVMYIKSRKKILKHSFNNDKGCENPSKKYDVHKNILWWYHKDDKSLNNITKHIVLRNIVKRKTRRGFFS